jgi:hypothetical protein
MNLETIPATTQNRNLILWLKQERASLRRSHTTDPKFHFYSHFTLTFTLTLRCTALFPICSGQKFVKIVTKYLAMDPTLAELIEPFVSTAREPLWEALFEAYKALGNSFKELSRQNEALRVSVQARTLELDESKSRIQELERDNAQLRTERESHQCQGVSSMEAIEGLRTVVNNLSHRVSMTQPSSRLSGN